MHLADIRKNLENAIIKAPMFFLKKNQSPNLLDIKKKSHQDYVTKTDLRIQDFLIEHISKNFPTIPVLSEEAIKEKQNIPDKCFVIDPLDGTLNYINDIKFYSISIAYIENSLPILGITFDPNLKELFVAELNQGLFINNKKIEITDTNSELIIISNDFLQLCLMKNPNIILDLRKLGKIRILGSQALHLAYVASGKALACINLEAKYWDDAAGYVMLKEAGFDYINFNGKNIFPKQQICPKENLCSVSGNKFIIKKIIKILNNL